MGTMDKFINFMKMNGEGEDDDYEYDDYEEETEAYNPQPRKSMNSAASKKADMTMDSEEDYEVAPRTKPAKVSSLKNMTSGSRKGQIMNSSAMEVFVCRPNTFDDATQIADALLASRSVVLNLEGIDMDLAIRIFDFATGACYALKGRLESISKYVYVITPESVYISGDTQEESTGALGKGFVNR